MSKPVVITTAAPSADEQLARRRRKYVVMMACRWAAVLIANDVPARRKEPGHRLGRRALSAGESREGRGE